MHAFRCKNCGHLEPAEHAGENEFPHACSVCSEGVSFTRQGIKVFDKDNWEVLADMSEADLKKIGLQKSGVKRHTPINKSDPAKGKKIERNVEEKLTKKDAIS